MRWRDRAGGGRAADGLARMAEGPCRGARRVAAGGARVPSNRFRQRVRESDGRTNRRRDPAGRVGGCRSGADQVGRRSRAEARTLTGATEDTTLAEDTKADTGGAMARLSLT